MPAKRRAPAAQPSQPKKARLSRLAKENNLTAEEESEIKEAFQLFAEPQLDDFPDEKNGVLPVADVRRALIALGLSPTSKDEMHEIMSTLDPTDVGFVPYEPFVTVCALKMHARTSTAQTAEIEQAFQLFTAGTKGPISVAHLRRIARELKEDIGEEQLRDMILEANGGAGVNKGVRLDEFEGVMKRAGVFS
ncbi:MAG: centrin, EF-hand protein [Caeruleum heppii]|nr:MAG: centrin, EF-hand protein [Caeruleum heppii]